MSQMLSRTWKGLGSLKFTILLIISLAVMFLLGLLIPQKELLGKEAYLLWRGDHPSLVSLLESLQLTDLYRSPLSLVLWGLFFLNLALVMAPRLPATWRRCFRVEIPKAPEALKGRRNYRRLEGTTIDSLGRVLKGEGYTLFHGAGSLVALKNRFSPLGTMLFHLSFVMILIGGAATVYTRFRAEADVAVGETFSGGYSKILKRPRMGEIPFTSFTVALVKPTYFDRNVTVDLDVEIDSRHGRKSYGVNRPFRDGSLSFVINEIDIAPLFVVQDAAGRELDGAVVKLKVLKGAPDEFHLAGYRFRALFHTDYLGSGAAKAENQQGLPQALKQHDAGRSQDREIVNPAFTLEVYRGETLVASGLVRPGESLSFDGRRVVFSAYDYWVHFYAGSERGLLLVYGGFLLMTLALVLRLGFPRKEIAAVSDGTTLHLAGRGEYYPLIFQEQLEKIITRLELDPVAPAAQETERA
jgi:hypothetical protein